jgi:hypothetical protein
MRRLLCLLVAIALLMLCRAATAQCNPDWFGGGAVPGVSGDVNALTVWDPDGSGPLPPELVVGGQFATAGQVVASNIAAWDGAVWHPIGGGIDGVVLAVTVYHGDLIAAGQFTNAGGVAVRSIARWDGQGWHPLGEGIGGSVLALGVYHDELIVGGGFRAPDGSHNLARWDGSSWLPLGGVDGMVQALTEWNGGLIVGGSFTAVNQELDANGIARWDGTGWSSLGEGFSAPAGPAQVKAVAGFGSQLVAGGTFTTSGATPVAQIASWDGASWHALGEGVASGSWTFPDVRSVAPFGGQLAVGGVFNSAGGNPAPGFAWWDGASWHAPADGAGASYALTTFGDRLVAGGSFGFGLGNAVPVFNIAAWDGAHWSALGPPPMAPLGRLAVVDGALYGGAAFWYGPTTGYAGLGRWTGAEWEPLTFYLSPFGGTWASAMAEADGHLVAAENTLIAAWSGSAWTTVGLGSGPGFIRALANDGGDLIAGGQFAAVDGVPAANIARRTASGWQPMGGGFTAPAYGGVLALTLYAGDLIAAGSFADSGGTVSNIARWDGSSWQPLGAGCDGRVVSLVVYGSDLIAAGVFGSAGGIPAANIARWDGASWSPFGSGMNGGVWALTVHEGDLVAGGSFTTAGGVAAAGLARWDGSGWHAIPGSPRPPGLQGLPGGVSYDFGIYALASFNGDLFVGGSFTSAGTISAYGWARWGCTCYANCDNSATPPVLNVADFVCFQERFVAGEAYANCDGSTVPPVLNIADFVCFMQRFVAGCP